MSTAKQAFADVRAAEQRISDRMLKLSELAALKREVLGWDSNVAKFRKFADEQIANLPRGDKQKKVLRRQKADLSKVVNALRDSIATYENALRLSRATSADNKSEVRFNKAEKQIVDAVRRMIEIDPDRTAEFLRKQIGRTVTVELVPTQSAEETSSEEVVEVTN